MAECVTSATGLSPPGIAAASAVTPIASTQLQNLDAGSWLSSRSGWSAISSSNTISRDFLARSDRRLHLHAGGSLTLAGGGQHALAFHLHHAGAAVAVSAVAGRGVPAQVRDVGAVPLRHLPDGFTRLGLDRLAIQLEGDLCRHGSQLFCSISTKPNSTSLAVRTVPGSPLTAGPPERT